MAGIPEGPDAFFRLSPAERAKAQSFGVKRGEIAGRFDVNYWQLGPYVTERLGQSAFQVEALGSAIMRAQYGSSTLARPTPPGVPILRMNNLQDDGWALDDLKYVELSEGQIESYRLEPGDILFNRTNSKELVGKCAVFREPGLWVFASYLIRVRTNPDKLNPQFAADFLSAPIGRLQIDRLSRQIIGMTNINAEEIRDLRIPLPPMEQQEKMVAAMDAARAERQTKLAEASELMEDMDAIALNAAGIGTIVKPPLVFAAQARQLRGAITPERLRGAAIERQLALPQCIGDVAELIEDRVTPSRADPNGQWNWIRIDDLPNRPLGVKNARSVAGNEMQGSFLAVRKNDILLARLGPTILNAKFVLCPKLEGQTLASPEFLVLRCKQGYDPEAVLWVLRTKLYRDLMYFRSRGGTPSRYRLDGDDLLDMPFPLISEAAQCHIKVEATRRRSGAQRLRFEAEEGWQAAKRRFEIELLGEPAA